MDENLSLSVPTEPRPPEKQAG